MERLEAASCLQVWRTIIRFILDYTDIQILMIEQWINRKSNYRRRAATPKVYKFFNLDYESEATRKPRHPAFSMLNWRKSEQSDEVSARSRGLPGCCPMWLLQPQTVNIDRVSTDTKAVSTYSSSQGNHTTTAPGCLHNLPADVEKPLFRMPSFFDTLLSPDARHSAKQLPRFLESSQYFKQSTTTATAYHNDGYQT